MRIAHKQTSLLRQVLSERGDRLNRDKGTNIMAETDRDHHARRKDRVKSKRKDRVKDPFPGVVYSVGADTYYGNLRIDIKIPRGSRYVQLYTLGNFAVTPYESDSDQEKLRAYDQMYAERDVINAQIRKALKPVLTRLYRTIWTLAIAGEKIDGKIMPATYDDYLRKDDHV